MRCSRQLELGSFQKTYREGTVVRRKNNSLVYKLSKYLLFSKDEKNEDVRIIAIDL